MSIVKATRTHYAMMKHKAGPGRIKVETEVRDLETGKRLHAGVLYIADTSPAVRKRALNRAVNVLGAMYADHARITARVSVVQAVLGVRS